MNNAEVLKTLRSAPDLAALKDAVLKMCGPRGPAVSHEFIFHSNERSVSCLLEMKYALPDAEMREFDAYGFGNMVCLDFNVASARHQGLRASSDTRRAQSGPQGAAGMSPKTPAGDERVAFPQLAMAA
jgi:hypothetical protein